MQDAWRAYLELASGLTEASRKKARQVAKDLFGKGGATAAQVQSAAAELVSTSRTNRETLARLVRYEVDRALGAVGLATAEEVTELTGRVQDLERRLRRTAAAAEAIAVDSAADRPPAGRTAAERTPAKQAGANKAATKRTTAKKTAARKAATKKTATKTAAKKTAAGRTPAKKASAKQSAAAKKTAASTVATASAPTSAVGPA